MMPCNRFCMHPGFTPVRVIACVQLRGEARCKQVRAVGSHWPRQQGVLLRHRTGRFLGLAARAVQIRRES